MVQTLSVTNLSNKMTMCAVSACMAEATSGCPICHTMYCLKHNPSKNRCHACGCAKLSVDKMLRYFPTGYIAITQEPPTIDYVEPKPRPDVIAHSTPLEIHAHFHAFECHICHERIINLDKFMRHVRDHESLDS